MAGPTEQLDYGDRTVPPATPPVINENADAAEAATRPDRNGDSDFPGNTPDEVQPQQAPADNPGRAPDELVPDGGDTDEPDSAPMETPPPPD